MQDYCKTCNVDGFNCDECIKNYFLKNDGTVNAT